MNRSWMLGGVGGLLLASVLWARPGIVKTQDGQVFTGDVTERPDEVAIDNKGIHTTIARENLRSITYSDSIEEEYRKRLAKLTPYDVAGRMELAHWLYDNRAYDLALNVLQEAARIQPINEDVRRMINTINRQVELEQTEARKNAPVQLAAADNRAAAGAAAGGAASPAPVGRLLTPEEINLIRQSEWQANQPMRATFRDDVRRKYIAAQGMDPATFNRMTPAQQAWAIVSNGTPDMRKDVILTDPPAMATFKRVQTSLLQTGCAACHGTQNPQGNFMLHLPADSDAATYTNFLILSRYQAMVGDRAYLMIDRERPNESLLIQFSLPSDLGQPPHPKAPNYHGSVHTRNDPRLKTALDWISSLNPVAPDYSEINLSPKGAATRPIVPPGNRPAAPAPRQ